jgi:hypothetical protein
MKQRQSSCRPPRDTKLRRGARLGSKGVLTDLLSPHEGAAMSGAETLDRGNRRRRWSCTLAHVLKLRIRDRTKPPKVPMNLLSPRTRAALGGTKRKSCTEL